jgi:hypothetical protein
MSISKEELEEIGRQVHEDYQEILKKVEKDSEYLDRLSEKRAQQKHASRKQDEHDLKSGAKTARQLNDENGFLKSRECGIKIDFSKAPVAG